MATFQEDDLTAWTPPSDIETSPYGSLVVKWLDRPEIDLKLIGERPHTASWLSVWLLEYLDRQPEEDEPDNPDLSFLYIVLGQPTDRPPHGTVDGTSILEIGYGGDPVGPLGATYATLETIVRFTASVLG